MDLNAVRMFVQVAQLGSLSAAAEKLGTPLATLSRRVRELEAELKVQLVERTTRGTILTEAGARLYEHAARGLEQLNEAEQAVLSDQARLRGRLRLSLPPSFEPWWALLAAFQERYPDIRLSVFTTERRVDLVQDGIDVALRVGAILDEQMVAREVTRYRHVLVGAPSLCERLGVPRDVADLHRFPCAVWSADVALGGRWVLGGESFVPSPLLGGNDYLPLREAALRGAAITELPSFLARPHLESGALVKLLPEQPLPEQSLTLVYPSQRHPSSLVRAYLAFCREQASRYL